MMVSCCEKATLIFLCFRDVWKYIFITYVYVETFVSNKESFHKKDCQLKKNKKKHISASVWALALMLCVLECFFGPLTICLHSGSRRAQPIPLQMVATPLASAQEDLDAYVQYCGSAEQNSGYWILIQSRLLIISTAVPATYKLTEASSLLIPGFYWAVQLWRLSQIIES